MRQAVLLLLGMLIAMPAMAQIKEPEPDYQAMRRYRISQFSEENLNKFHAEAESEAKTEYAKAMADHQKEEADTAKSQARCTETGFKEKNPMICWRGITFGMKFEPMLPTVAQRYEQKVMGICNYAFKMEDAIKWHCLPG